MLHRDEIVKDYRCPQDVLWIFSGHRYISNHHYFYMVLAKDP